MCQSTKNNQGDDENQVVEPDGEFTGFLMLGEKISDARLENFFFDMKMHDDFFRYLWAALFFAPPASA
jgi:hypothetical protein